MTDHISCIRRCAASMKHRLGRPGFPCLLLAAAMIMTASCASTGKSRVWQAGPSRALTVERLAALPVPGQVAWRAYIDASVKRAGLLPPRSQKDGTPAQAAAAAADLTSHARHTAGLVLDMPDAWYATEEAAVLADRVVAWQSAAGAWTKGIDYTVPRPPPGTDDHDIWSGGTLDNDATSREMRFLQKVLAAAAVDSPRAQAWRDCYLRALDYLFAAQYPNGGFPQVYPLAGGYHDAITFNDDVMVNALGIFQAVAGARPGCGWVPQALREEAGRRLERGVDCILAAQMRRRHGGRRTVWGQQHDMLTLAPCTARNFEPVSATSKESAEILRFLMGLDNPPPRVVAAVHDAAAWFDRVALQGVVWDREAASGTGLVETPGAPRLWARIYEIGTDRPIFGDRDRSIHYTVTRVSAERRHGYGWYGIWPEEVLAAFQEWRLAHPRP